MPDSLTPQKGVDMTCPKHLSKEAAGIWEKVCLDFTLEYDHRVLLREALEMWDLAQDCRKKVAKEGAVVRHANGMQYQNPNGKIEFAARAHFLKCWRELGIGYQPAAEPGRPPQ